MIKPSIGRVMWYWPEKDKRQEQPMPALVTWVWGDNMVNLVVFDSIGNPTGKTSIPIVQDGSSYTVSDNPYVEWMPYQIGQAKKHEEENKLA